MKEIAFDSDCFLTFKFASIHLCFSPEQQIHRKKKMWKKSMCASASKLMKLVLKLHFCSLQIALVLRNIFEIKIMLQNTYNAITNWNLANFYCWENRKGNKFLKHYSSFLVAAIILVFLLLLPLFHSLPCMKQGSKVSHSRWFILMLPHEVPTPACSSQVHFHTVFSWTIKTKAS